MLSLHHTQVRTRGHQVSNRPAIPHQVHDLTTSHPVDRPRQGDRILHRQFLGIHARQCSERIPQLPVRSAALSGDGTRPGCPCRLTERNAAPSVILDAAIQARQESETFRGSYAATS
jgi:hypothetical protein